ncbi:hypothetical protein [Maritalea sp.]|uniref:hypothetical protein n=1 Tax=Maritalea sp. TaxID=2003361 RepID=UPI003EF1DAB2
MARYTQRKRQRLGIEKPEAKPLVKTIIAITSVCSAVLLGLAAPALLDSSTAFDFVKIGVLVLAVGTITFGVNILAIDRIAPLAAIGIKSAFVAGAAAILLVGSALFASTYAGLVRPQVAELRLQAFGDDLTSHMGAVHEQALEAGRIVPIIRANAADREQNLSCEIQQSCLSEHPVAGDGPVARLLRSHVVRATLMGCNANMLTISERYWVMKVKRNWPRLNSQARSALQKRLRPNG